MLGLFRDEIPDLDQLLSILKPMIQDNARDLTDIRETIRDHILDVQNIDIGDAVEINDEKISQAESISYDAVDDLIYELDVNEVNYRRIKDYISTYHNHAGFNRLIVDFRGIVSDKERRQLIDQGKKIFGVDVTEHWE